MSGAGTAGRMHLKGYIDHADHGFALPAYQAGEGDQWYVAVSAVEGDHLAPIVRFEPLELLVAETFESGIEVAVGDTWQDVFLWKDRPYAGAPEAIFAGLEPFHGEIGEAAPLSFVDLASAAGAAVTADAAERARAFLVDMWGVARGEDCFCEAVIRPGVLLVLRRAWHVMVEQGQADGENRLVNAFHDVDVRSLGEAIYEAEIDLDWAASPGGDGVHMRLQDAMASFGQTIGASLSLRTRAAAKAPVARTEIPVATSEGGAAIVSNVDGPGVTVSEPEEEPPQGMDWPVDASGDSPLDTGDEAHSAGAPELSALAPIDPLADAGPSNASGRIPEERSARDADHDRPRGTAAAANPPAFSQRGLTIFDRFFKVEEIGIDLGTANTRVVLAGRGIVLDEPSLIAFESIGPNKRVLAVGEDVTWMQAAQEQNVRTIRPLQNGAIVDADAARDMIAHFIAKLRSKHDLPRRLNAIVSTSAGTTSVERRAVRDAAWNAGVREVRLIEAPTAAAIGADMPTTQPIASMVVDLGAGRTDVAVLSARGMTYSKRIRAGGDQMDAAIVAGVRRNYNFGIDLPLAERIKNQVGRADGVPFDDNSTVVVSGRGLVLGLPQEDMVSIRLIAELISESVSTIVEAVRLALENLAPGYSRDLIDQGIGLTGGVAQLQGLDKVLRDETGLPVYVTQEPLTCVARGMGVVLEGHVPRTFVIGG